MNCKKCNSPLSEGTIFCPNCGEKVVTDVVTSETEVEPVDNVENNITEAANTVNQTVPVERKRSKASLIIGIIAVADTRVPIVKATVNNEIPWVEVAKDYKYLDSEGDICIFEVLDTSVKDWELKINEQGK
jgi:uncharacterized Zn finger protein (UPF0148 family)